MGDEPPYLTVGTEVSAKYKGAFCEAKIKKVVRTVKCKVTFKSGLGSTLLSDENIKGTLRVGSNVEARHPDKNLFIEATINKIQDCSQYTVVFDDGDITTLKRSALVLKSGRHFNESETLDQLPLTHPEHFSNPVVAGRRNIRKRSEDGDDSSGEEDTPVKKGKKKAGRGDVDIGKVVCVEITDKKKSKDNWFPALVVAPNCQETVKIRTKEEYLVRSFRDGRYYTVPKKEITDFTKDAASKVESSSNVLKTALEKAVQYLERNELPPHWDKDVLFASVLASTAEPEVEDEEEGSDSSEVSDEDILGEEKDRFVAQLYKFMDDRGTPINKVPVVCNKDLDLYKLYKIVSGKGGYNKVTNSSQWKPVTVKMGFGSMPTTSTINLVKQAYKKFLHNFEEFFRKLGCSLSLNSLSSSTKSRSNRSIFRDRHASSSSKETKREEPKASTSKELKSEAEEKAKKGFPTVEPNIETVPVSVETDIGKIESADPDGTPRRSRSRLENRSKKDTEESPEKSSSSTKGFEKSPAKTSDRSPAKSQEKSPSKTPEKILVKSSDKLADKIEKPGKKRRLFVKDLKEAESAPKPADEPEPAPPTPPPVASVATMAKKGVGRGKYKRKSDKEPAVEPEVQPLVEEVIPDHIGNDVTVLVGDKLQVYYGPKSDGKVTYDAKVIDVDDKKQVFLVHYTGWNTRYDEWIPRTRISENSSLRTDQVVCPPQGRGPGQSSVSDSAASSDAGSVSRESGTAKGVKKKPRPVLPPSTTRSKSGITTRKRLSSEGDAISTKRKTRKRAVSSGGESGDDSSDTEDTNTVVGLLSRSPRNTKKAKSDYTFDLHQKGDLSRTPEVDPETSSRDKDMQVLDLNQIRSELKGLDKCVKVDSSSSTTEISPDVKMDVYEFEDDLSEIPKPKAFAPKSPERHEKEELSISAKVTDEPEAAVESHPRIEPGKSVLTECGKIEDNKSVPLELQVISPSSSEIGVLENPAERKLKEDYLKTAVPVIESPLQPVEPLAPSSVSLSVPTTPAMRRQLQCAPVSALSASAASKPEPVAQTKPPPLVTSVPTPVRNLIQRPVTSSSQMKLIPSMTSRANLPVIPCPSTSATTLISQAIVTPSVVRKVEESSCAKMDDSKPGIPEEVKGKLAGFGTPVNLQTLKTESSVIAASSPPVVEKRIPEILKLPPKTPQSGAKITLGEKKTDTYATSQATETPKPVIVGKVMPFTSTPSTSVISSTSKETEPANIKKKKKIGSKSMPEPSASMQPVAPLRIQPLKRPIIDAANKPPVAVKKPKKLVSLQPAKIPPGVIQIPSLTSIVPTSGSTRPGTSTPLRLPFAHGTPMIGGMGTIVVSPFRPTPKPSLAAERNVIAPLKTSAVPATPKKIIVKPITPKGIPIPSSGRLNSPAVSKPLPASEKLVRKNVKQPPKPAKVIYPGTVATSSALAPKPFTPVKLTSIEPDIKKETPVTTAVFISVAPEPAPANTSPVLPVREEKKGLPVEIKSIVDSPTPFAIVGRPMSVSGQLQIEIPAIENKSSPDLISGKKLVSSLSEEESCHSLLCEEEIPGSPPPPELDAGRFLCDDESARHHSPTPTLSSNDDVNPNTSVQLPVSFASICPKPAPEQEEKPTPTLEQYNTPKTHLDDSFAGEQHQIPLSPNLKRPQAKFEDGFIKDQQDTDSAPGTAYPDPDLGIDNSPPTSPESSSSLSSESPRDDDGERLSPVENNSNKAHASDTDSMDSPNKPGDTGDVSDNSNSSDASRRFDDNPPSPVNRNISSVGGNEHRDRDGSPPGKRRRIMRRKSPDETVRSYRGGRHSTAPSRRIPGGNVGGDPDVGRMPPPQPPINLGKPPRSDKFNFIPVLTDDMDPEERIALIQVNIMNLKQQYMEVKTEQMLVERRKKRLKKREREREKEVLKTST